MKYILEVKNLSKDFLPPLSFGSLTRFDFRKRFPVRALDGVSFTLERGKILCVLGPNGAGKTTLLKIISTLILPNKGTVSIHPLTTVPSLQNALSITWPGEKTKGFDPEEKIKSCIGLVAEEERSFYWRLSARQNLEFFATLYGLDKRAIQARINALFELFEIDEPDKRFDAYSTGMKRRLALIRGLIHNPQLLLLDEPTKSLDYACALHLRNFIKERLVKTEGKTVIFTTHQMEEALRFADLFMLLDKGELFAFGTLDELRKKINSPTATLGEIFVKMTNDKAQNSK